MPLLAARSLYEAPAIVVTPPVEELVAGRNWYWPQEETVYLTGVAASPQVGKVTLIVKGTLDDLARKYPFPRQQVAPKQIPRIAPRRKPAPEQAPPETVVVSMTGVKAVSAVGTGTVKMVFELLDDEILALLEAA